MNKIINILDLDDHKSITLYKLDNDTEKQHRILDLIPDIKKYYSYSCIKGVRDTHNVKRPYLSIIKHLTKQKYDMISSDHRITVNNKKIRTKRYFFMENKY